MVVLHSIFFRFMRSMTPKTLSQGKNECPRMGKYKLICLSSPVNTKVNKYRIMALLWFCPRQPSQKRSRGVTDRGTLRWM